MKKNSKTLKVQTYEEFTSEVNAIMKKRYGLNPEDFDSPSESMFSSFSGGETPEEHADWENDKYGPFKRVDQDSFYGI